MRDSFDAISSAVLRGVLSAAILLLSALGIANVIARNFLGESLASANELSQALLVTLTFVGAAVAAREARHIRMSALVDLLPARARKACWCVASACTALLLAALAAFSLDYVLQVAARGRVTPALRVPLAAIFAVAPLGLAAAAVEYALIAWRNLRSPRLHLARDDEGEAPLA